MQFFSPLGIILIDMWNIETIGDRSYRKEKPCVKLNVKTMLRTKLDKALEEEFIMDFGNSSKILLNTAFLHFFVAICKI